MSKLTLWINSHKESASTSLAKAIENPVSFLFTTLLIAIAFAIPMSIYILFSSVEQLTSQWDSDRQITLFLKEDVSFKDAKMIADNISQQNEIDNIKIIDRDEVLEKFKQESNFNLFPDTVGGNPLPHIIVIAPKLETDIQALTNTLKTLSEVQHVQFDLIWFERLRAFAKVILRIQWIVSGLLIFTVALIIINVIRWEISSRQSEIEIIKLIGASDAYARRPFMYFGGLLGLTGSGLAVIIVTASAWLINLALMDLTNLFDSDYKISSLPFLLALTIIILGGLIGIVAASLAANQRIKLIN
ncbi:MAG: ABC transporter permease [Pseudomonadota bacterium]